MQLNINDKLKVKLTESGEAAYRAHLESIPGVNVEHTMQLSLDDDGLHEFSIWEMMQVFGPVMYHGMSEMPFEGNEITIVHDQGQSLSM